MQRALKDHGRYPYAPIHRRRDYTWAGGKRLAVYLGFNIEHFDFGAGLGAALGPKSPEPDVLNYSWRDYGNRVGVWRCLELFDQLKLPAAALINTALGIFAAIVGIVSYNFFVNKVDNFTYMIDEASYDVIQTLTNKGK